MVGIKSLPLAATSERRTGPLRVIVKKHLTLDFGERLPSTVDEAKGTAHPAYDSA